MNVLTSCRRTSTNGNRTSPPPRAVSRAAFDAQARRLDIHLDFVPGSRFACPGCGTHRFPVHDTETEAWRHFNFFQHQA